MVKCILCKIETEKPNFIKMDTGKRIKEVGPSCEECISTLEQSAILLGYELLEC